MKTCARQDEVVQVVRAGQWPQGCAAELRAHVERCARCADEARMMSVFAAAREGTMRMAAPQSAGLLWWRAQLRRRHDAMERLERPGLAISTVTIMASVVVLMAAFATAWKRTDWLRLATVFSPAGWNAWIVFSLAAVLFGFAVVAVMVGLGLPERRG